MSLTFELYTVVDITNTGARRGEDAVAYKQMQNYLTVLNTLGLRANPVVNKAPKVIEVSPDIEFGKNVKAKHCWKLDFEYESDGVSNIDLMKDDFQLVPFIKDLKENIKFNNNVFLTKGNECNIVFKHIDK